MKADEIVEYPSIVLIMGRRGSGKTCLGLYLTEKISENEKVPVCLIGFPPEKRDFLPESYLLVSSFQYIPEKCVIFVDEAAYLFHSRRSMSDVSVEMDKLISQSRQKKQMLIFTAHFSRKLDINIVTDIDTLFFKEQSGFHSRLERREIRDLVEEARETLQRLKVRPDEDKRKYSYAVSHDFTGIVENSPPSFWHEELSNLFAGVESTPSLELKGIPTPSKSKKGKKEELPLDDGFGASKITLKGGFAYDVEREKVIVDTNGHPVEMEVFVRGVPDGSLIESSMGRIKYRDPITQRVWWIRIY